MGEVGGSEITVRQQRKRSGGWKAPANNVYCGRGSMWGNPFQGDRATVVDAYREWLLGESQFSSRSLRRYKSKDLKISTKYAPTDWRRENILRNLDKLRGKVLLCWCAPAPCQCHVDVLIELIERLDSKVEVPSDIFSASDKGLKLSFA